jgi:hypothetical protein
VSQAEAFLDFPAPCLGAWFHSDLITGGSQEFFPPLPATAISSLVPFLLTGLLLDPFFSVSSCPVTAAGFVFRFG